MQDFIFAIGSILLWIALLPSVFRPEKPHFLTSLLTALVLFTFAGAYLSLDLFLATITTWFTGMTWIVLAYQALDSVLRDRNVG